MVSLALAVIHYVPQDKTIADQTEQSSTTDTSKDVTVVKLSDAIQTHFQVNLSFQSFLVDVVVVSIVSAFERIPSDQFILSQSKSFKILLQQFISTNAP